MPGTNRMNYSYGNKDQIWPGNWMENNSHPSKDNLLSMDGKQSLRYLNRNPGSLKMKSKVHSVIQYFRNLVKL